MTELPAIFHLAKEVAKLSDHGKFKIGAVLYQKGKPISLGRNYQYKTHPLMRQFGKYLHHQTNLHAELDALISVRHKTSFKGCKMVVYRESLAEAATSRPCPTCMLILKNFGIKEVYYTTKGGFAKETLL